MKVSFLISHLEKVLPFVSKIIPAHAQLPVLSHVLLEASPQGFFISATDLELGVKVNIPAKIEEEGAVTIPGKQFLEVIASLPKDKVTISQEKDAVIITSHENKITFQTIPKDEFPDFFKEKGEVVMSFTAEEFRSIFSTCLFATSPDPSRPQLTGVFIKSNDTSVSFVATDGFRLSVKTLGLGIKDNKVAMIVSSRLLMEALALKPEKNSHITMYTYKDGNQVIFETDSTILVGRLLEGEFPNYTRVIPASFVTTLEIDKEEFISAIKLCSVFARENANVVKLHIEEGEIQFSAKSQGVGEGEVVVNVKHEGDVVDISFNTKYLLDVLRVIDTKTFMLHLNKGQDPAMITIPNDETFQHIIMPVRVQE